MGTSSETAESGDNLRRFLLVLRRALYMVIREIETMYGLQPSTPSSRSV